MVYAEGDSNTGYDGLERCWEIMDGLERALLELTDVVSEEPTSFGVSSLTTWKDSCTRISRITGELSVSPFDIPLSGFPLSTVPTSLSAMDCPTDPSIRPKHKVNDMIRCAILDSPLGKLPSRDIMAAIHARFPYYRVPDHAKKLKNTIRYHLSNTKCFIKIAKDASMSGKGNYWTYDPKIAQVTNARIVVPDIPPTTQDRYFDDCSWSSLLLLEGIEAPIQRMYPREEEIPLEVQSLIGALNYLVDEMKLNGNIDDRTREFFITIISYTSSVAMKGPENASLDFWNAAAGALQAIDLEKRLDQETVDLLHRSWNGFVNSHIQPDSTPSSASLPTSRDPIAISLPMEMTRLDHEITPATKPLISLLQALGREAPKATRNKHKIYATIVRARDICNHTLTIGTSPEFNGLNDLDEYYHLIDATEGALLSLARLLPMEQVDFGPEMCVSWSESREEFCKVLDELRKLPFKFNLRGSEQKYANIIAFDDCYWFSLLLHDGIEKELAQRYPVSNTPPAVASVIETLRYLENEIRHGHFEDARRELVIDIATQLYGTLSIPASEEDRDAAFPIQSVEPPAQIQTTEDRLFTQLSDAFSSLDLDSSLQPSDVETLGQRWRNFSAL